MRDVLLSGMLLSLLIACEMPQEMEAEKAVGGGNVRVSIQVDQGYSGVERSVFPQVTLNDINYYALWGASVGSEEAELLPSFTTQGASVVITEGVWNFTVKGYNNDDALLLQGELRNQTISPGSQTLSFSVEPLLESTGSISITITLPDNSGVTTVLVFKDGVDGVELKLPEPSLTGNQVSYSEADVDAGDYYYTFRLNNDAGNTLAVVSQIVQVRARLSSEKNIELTKLNTPPVAPSAVPLVESEDSQLRVSWEPVDMAGDYEVYYSDTTTPPTASAQIVNNITTTVITGLTNGVTYYVWVKAQNAAGSSDFSLMASGTPRALLDTPFAITLAPQDDVDIPDQSVIIPRGGRRTFQVTGTDTYKSYQWYLDGTVINGATAASYTLNTASIRLGAHELSVIVVNSADEQLSGNCSVTIDIGTPGTPTVTASPGQLAVSWNAVTGADEYEVYYGTTEIPPGTPAQTVATLNTAFTDLTNGTTYYVWVKAKGLYGVSDFSPIASGKPLGVMGTVTVTPSFEALTVSWDAVAGADSYEVYYSTGSTAPSVPGENVVITGYSATISGLTNGTTYYVWVKAKNAAGISPYSDSVRGKPLATPKSPTVIASASGTLTVSWEAAASAESYEVYYGTSQTPPETPTRTVTTLSTTLTGLADGTTYYVWVKAKNQYGASGFSPIASGKPLGGMGTVTVTPSYEALIVSWDAVAGADSYEVYYSTAPSEPGENVVITGTSATISGLDNGTIYYVWVKAKNAIGVSPYSERASGTPSVLAVPPEAPNTPVISIGNAQLTVSWTEVANTLEYEVYYGTSSTPATLYETVSDLSISITGLTNGTLYYVRLKAKNTTGTSPYSEAASGTPSGKGNASISIGFNYGQITIEGNNGINAISKSGANGMPTSLSLSANGYTNVSCYVDGDTTNRIVDSGTGIVVPAVDYPVQIHSITFTGIRNGILYSQEISFTVFN
jgi:fibronectin type 3 domain-containing protein